MLKGLFTKKPPLAVAITSHALRFEMARGKTLLEAAQDAGIGFPCDCKVGTCGTCRYRLDEGTISELKPSAAVLGAEELRAGWRLGCQSMPRTDLSIFLPGLVSEIGPPPSLFEGRIAGITPLTQDIVELRLQLNRRLTFVAGQYADLSVDEVEGPRSYSFAASPENESTDQPCFHVRKVPGGAFTGWLFGGDRSGAHLMLRGPLGSFRLRKGESPIVCVGGGSGLAPLKCILEQALRQGCTRPVTLLYGARTQADLFCLEEIAAIGRNWAGPFRFLPALSLEPAESAWTGARGLVADLLPAQENLPAAQAYLCGPPPMVDAAEALLLRHGVAAESIFADRFFDRSRPASPGRGVQS